MKWISVKEQLPEDNQRCIVATIYLDDWDYEVFTTYFHMPENKFMKDDGCYISEENNYIYWMPIPEIPNAKNSCSEYAYHKDLYPGLQCSCGYHGIDNV